MNRQKRHHEANTRGTCYTKRDLLHCNEKKFLRVSSKDTTTIIISVEFCFEAFCYLVTSLLLLCHKPSVTRKAWQGMTERTDTRSVIIRQSLSPTFSIGLNNCFVVIWWLLLSVVVVSLSCFWKYINHSVNATCQTHLVIPTKEKPSCLLCSCTCCLFFSSGCCLPTPGLLAVFSFPVM